MKAWKLLIIDNGYFEIIDYSYNVVLLYKGDENDTIFFSINILFEKKNHMWITQTHEYDSDYITSLWIRKIKQY